MDPDEKFSYKDLCELIESDMSCMAMIAFFLVNTCVRAFKGIDNETEKRSIVKLISSYIA